MTSSLHTLTARLAAVEARLAELEGGHGATLYHLRRESVATKINVERIMTYMNLRPATDDDVDAVLDAE